MGQTVSSFGQQKYDAGVAKVDMKFEVALIPVSDVDRAKEFYTSLGWRLDDDIVVGDDFRVVQLTPPGSGCSISFGKGVTTASRGSFRGGLIVSDIEKAHEELVARGIHASEVFHGSPFSPAGRSAVRTPSARAIAPTSPLKIPMATRGSSRRLRAAAPGRIDPATTAFASASDLASAMRRAAAAHSEHEKGNGLRDQNWAEWYAAYMASEQVGAAPPK